MTTSSSVMSVRDRADRFRSLHEGDEPLRLVNVWDLVSARVAELAGAPALATSSFAIAVAQGYPDGEHVPWPVVRELVARIVDAVDVPVSVDIEAGRGAAPDAVAATVTDVVEAGGVGINLEDSHPDQPGALFTVDEQCERLAAARRVADADGVHRYVNARCDVWFGAAVAPEEQLAEGRRRVRRYVDAGADGIFLPGLVDVDDLRVMVDEAGVPVNVMLWPGVPPVAALRAAGVRRISQGAASFLVALGGLEQTTRSYLAAAAPAEPEPGAPMPAMHLVEPLTASRR
jgi:2-methylisocitrate lyase-like PEP mutase family enzyme